MPVLTPVKLSAVALLVFIVAACSTPAAPTATPAPDPTATPAAPAADQPADSASAPAGLRTFVVVPDQSKASYHVQEEFFSGMLEKYGLEPGHPNPIGSTSAIEGQLELDLGNLTAPLGSSHFQVDLSTLTSNQSRRDNWLRTNSFIRDAPTAEFTATGIEGAPATYTEGQEVTFKLNGDLTVNNQTKPVTFDVTAKLEGDTITGTATAQLRMTDFGVDPPNFVNTLTVQDDFELVVDFTARAQ